MDSLITFIAAPIVVLVGILAALRRPTASSGLQALRVTRRTRTWGEPAVAERAVERLRG